MAEVEFNLGLDVVRKIQSVGRAESVLKSVLDNDIFDKLSKHDPYWHSDYDVEAEKLDELRRILDCMHDNLWGVMSILRE